MNDDRRTNIFDVVNPDTRVPATSRFTTATQQASEDEDEVIEESRCRISRRAQMMLGFRRCNGEVEVLPYSMLTRIRTSDSATMLKLSFPAGDVTIEGDSLTSLFHYLCEHRVMEIVESDRAGCMNSANEVVVTSIRIAFG